jgi:hypothetical protein
MNEQLFSFVLIIFNWQHQQMSGGIPIFQINGQMIAVDQQVNLII